MLQQIQERQALQEAIGQLYSVFAPYPLRRVVEGCSHCVSVADEKRLHEALLRALTEDQLERYAWKAMTTWGDVGDFKHFLPRLLEILVDDDFGFDLEIFGSKLGYAGYATWPEAERQAVEAFCRAWWRVLLATFPTKDSLGSYLCMFAHVLEDVRPLLEELRDSDETAAQRHFVRLCLDLCDVYAGLWLARRGWWADCPNQARQVADWMLEPTTALQLGLCIETLEAGGYGRDVEGAVWLKDVALNLMGKA